MHVVENDTLMAFDLDDMMKLYGHFCFWDPARFKAVFDSCPDFDSSIVSKLGTKNPVPNLHLKGM